MFFMQTISSGLGFYNMSVYMAEFAKTLALPLAQVSFAVTLFFIVGGVSGMYIARLLERIHVRWIIAGGAVLGGAALSAVSLADNLWQIYLLFTFFGVGYTCVSLVVATTLVTQWFPGSNRSVALSIASTGLSFGGIVVTPATAYLFNMLGAQATLPWLGLAFTGLILPIAIWIVRPAPQVAQHALHAEEGRWTYRAAVRTRFFIMLSCGYIFCQASQVGGIAHLYNRVTELADFATAATAVQVLTFCSILGRFSGGWMLMRISIRPFTLFNLFLQMLGLGAVSLADDADLALFGAGLFGVSVGNVLMLLPLWLAEAFPGGIYPRVFALSNAVMLLGVALGPFILGLAYDYSGYDFAYGVAVSLCLIAWLIIFSAGDKPRLSGNLVN
jgi:MFS family permease